MVTKKDGKKIVHNALQVILLTPDIRAFLEKRDPKALKQVLSAVEIFNWACDFTPEVK